MPSYRFNRLAREELRGAARYIAADNPAAARKFRDEFHKKLELLAQNPYIAPERPEFGANIRYHPHGNYLIFYVPEQDGITVIRVLHRLRLIKPEMFAPYLS